MTILNSISYLKFFTYFSNGTRLNILGSNDFYSIIKQVVTLSNILVKE